MKTAVLERDIGQYDVRPERFWVSTKISLWSAQFEKFQVLTMVGL